MPTESARPGELLPLPAVLRPPVADARRALALYEEALERVLAGIESVTDREEGRRVWLDALASLATDSERLRKSLNRVSAAVGLSTGAKGRLLAYLQLHVGEPMPGKKLGAVAGIGEWARRIRELRAEGYQIGSDETREDLNAGEYMLLAREPDTRVREQWARAEAIRKLPMTARERLLMYFREHAGQVLTADQLRHASRARDVRDLTKQLKELYPELHTHFEAADLSKGQYRWTS